MADKLPPSMAQRVRDFDWSQTALGPMERWPTSLRTAVSILLNSRFPMFVWWGPQRINIYNDAYSPMLGKRHPEALGKPAQQTWADIWDVVGPQSDLVFDRGEATWNDRVKLVMERQGYVEETYFTWSYSPVYDESGKVAGMFCAVIEETARVKAETAVRDLAEQLYEREDRFRQVANATPQIIYTATPDGRIDYYNRRWWDYIGVAEDVGVDGFRWQDYIHPDDLQRVSDSWTHSIRTGERQSVEFRMRSAAGEYRWFIARTVPARDESGRIYRWFGTSSDIDDRKRSEARDRFLVELDDAVRPLAEPEEITATYARLLGQHLNVDRCAYADVEADQDTFNLTGNYNRGVPSIVGRYRFVDFGQQVLDLMRANQPYVVNDIDTHQPPLADKTAYHATKIRSVICVPLHKRGRFVAAMAVHMQTPRVWRQEEVDLLLHIAARCWESIERARVTREREQLLESEQAARSEAERASRMKDEFLATLSHELRTPLNAIYGWSKILTTSKQADPELLHGLQIIERNARAQTQIIEDLLDMSRIISGKVRLDVQKLDPAVPVRAAIDTVRPAAEAKGVKLRATLDSSTGPISGDTNRLQQVFWNLLSNAVKFTPSGGNVDVTLQRMNSHLEVSVSDSGQGIKPEFLPLVFNRFSQADASTTRRFGGLGLGLSIVKQLVELHGGWVRAKSDGDGKGSTFIVALPLAAVLPATTPEAHARQPSADTFRAVALPSLAGLNVLVVDDEADARSMIARLLSEAGAKVCMAGSVREAIEQLDAATPDIVVSDIGMPGEDGYSLIRRIRQRPPEQAGRIPAVALTAYARHEDRLRAIQAGYHSHVAKPIEPVELITVIGAVAMRHVPPDPHPKPV